MARLYSDENFPLAVVVALRHFGHDVVTIQEDGEGTRQLPDNAVLQAASRSERALLTQNRRDFIRLHNTTANHSGIIVCTFDADFIGQARRIHDLVTSTPDLTGMLLRVNRPAK